MKHALTHYTTLLAALWCALSASAQQPWELDPRPTDLSAGRIFRSEMIPYDTRHDAESRNRSKAGYMLPFAPTKQEGGNAFVRYTEEVEIPYVWTDGLVYLHLENIGSAYTLLVNEVVVAEVEDPLTPAEFHLTPLIKQGKNLFRVELRPSRTPQINGEAAVRRAPFTESYLYYQNKRAIRDYEIALVPDSLHRDGILEVKLAVQNGYNYDEEVEAGYDIYSPQGKLLDFNMRAIPLPGRSVDTLRFNPYIYHVYENCWKSELKRFPPTYKVMLFMRRNGTYKEYLPLTLGFGRTELIGNKIVRFDEEVTLHKARYNAAIDRAKSATEIKALKAQGINTLCPSYPQPMWFYDLCTELGMYVIDCPAISAPDKRNDRTVGGTPSNDPTLEKEFIERVQAMYYRTRNQSCVIAYTLGTPSGNGYNMYKAYEWLKSVEKVRPVIYEDAAGEWNSDL